MPANKMVEGYPLALFVAVGGALLGSLQFGYQVGVLNTSLTYVRKELGYDNAAFLSSAVVLGAAFGAIVAGPIADWLGPKTAQLLNLIPFAAGSFLSSFTPYGQWGFLAGRLLSGFGAGAASLYAPRYIAEVAPTSLRGNLGAQHQVFINVGILCSYMMGIPYEQDCSHVAVFGHEVSWWRVMMAVAAIPLIVQFFVLVFSPESPVWLEGVDRELADLSCIKLWGIHAIVPDIESDTTASFTAPLWEEDMSRRPEPWTALLKREYRWMIALALGLPVLQQASGINSVVYYSSEVLAQSGVSSPILGSVVVGMVNVAFTLLAGFLMDHSGRRPLLRLSYAAMAVCLGGISIVSFVPGLHPAAFPQLQASLTTLMLLLYVAAFALGCGPITWVYLSEILPERIKGKAAALGTMLCWVGNLLVTATFDGMLDTLGLGGTYAVYAALNVAAALIVTMLVIETKRKKMAEIERELLLPA